MTATHNFSRFGRMNMFLMRSHLYSREIRKKSKWFYCKRLLMWYMISFPITEVWLYLHTLNNWMNQIQKIGKFDFSQIVRRSGEPVLLSLWFFFSGLLSSSKSKVFDQIILQIMVNWSNSTIAHMIMIYNSTIHLNMNHWTCKICE